MKSNDINQGNNFLTVEAFNSGIAELKTELKSEIRDVRYETAMNGAKIDWMQTSIYWGFAIIAFVVTFVAIFVPYLKREKEEKKEPELTVSKVQSMIDEALARALTMNPA